MAGFAGTGKTTLAKHLVKNANRRWLYAALTGKASHVMRQKGCDDATTIHSLIFRPNGESLASEIRELELKLIPLQGREEPTEEDVAEIARIQEAIARLTADKKPRFAKWENSPLADPDVQGVVIDECSMVDEFLGTTLESFGKKILVLGDPFQLPPVGAGGYYTKREPDVMLTEVHRHARDSAVLRLATMIREGWILNPREFGDDSDVFFLDPGRVDSDGRGALRRRVLEADQVLCGKNDTRVAANRRHRELIGKTDPLPVEGDRLVCLRNSKEYGLFNGSQWVVKSSAEHSEKRTTIVVESEDVPGWTVGCETWNHHFLGDGQALKEDRERRDCEEFDYSYCLTVHKAQGSQWNDVVLFDQSKVFRGDSRRWLYTGVTRAAKKLTVVI